MHPQVTCTPPPSSIQQLYSGFWATTRLAYAPTGDMYTTVVIDPTALFGLLGYNAAIVIGLVTELGRVTSWNAAPQLAFGLLLLTMTALLLPVALMAALKKRLYLSAL